MAKLTKSELISAWTVGDSTETPGPKKALKDLYDEGLQQYWNWLGDSFYPIFGITDFGLAKVDDLGSNPSTKEVQYYLAAQDLAAKLNFLNTQIFDLERPGDTSLASADWPEDVPSDVITTWHDYFNDVVVPVYLQIIENLKVIQENILISAPDGFNDSFGSGPFAFGQSPPNNLPDLIDAVIDSAPDFLLLFPDYSVSLKKDVAPLPDTSGLGPTPIFSDQNLENSLNFTTNQKHYIGFLLDPEKSDGERDGSYLPIRLAPAQEDLAMGWDDPNYSLLTHEEDLVKLKNKNSNGVEVPLGLEITVVEIVASETGIWVGFVSDDPRSEDIDVFESQQSIFYTTAHHVKIKESYIKSNPDPYISERLMTGDVAAFGVTPIKGTEAVKPMENQNWLQLKPNEVKMNYYSFNDHNEKILAAGGSEEIFYNTNTINSNPTLKYSEGYFYFIAGAQPRKTEAELINESDEDIEDSEESLNSAKQAAGASTMSDIKLEAWNNLLNYLGINTEGGNALLYNELYQKYFILVDKKVNTNSTNPNNQKALFAIRTSYVDSLPDVRRPYINDFESESPFLVGRNFAVALSAKDVRPRCDYLVDVLKKIKDKIQSSKSTVENSNGLEYELDVQIELMEKFPNILDDFMNRQAFPSSTNRSFIYDMVREGTQTTSNHLIQIGVKDNKNIGAEVRETISYVLFSPDPDELKDSSTQDSNLFYFDPYLSDEELENKSSLKRSAIPLRIGLPVLREKLEGVYGSRTLHLFLAYEKIKKQLTKGESDLQNNWMEFLSAFAVPPVRIYLSKDPSLVTPEELDCDELIEKLNKSGPNVGIEEKLLQEQLYNSPECMEKYFEQFNEDTHAGSPDLGKKELEAKGEIGEMQGKIMENEYVKILYTQFFNVLDVESLIAMIMACLQKKLGLAITAEAICETAIIKLVENIGPGPVEQAMLANALLSPDSPAAQSFLNMYPHVDPAMSAGAQSVSAGETITNETGAPLNVGITDKDGKHIRVENIPPGGSYTLLEGEHAKISGQPSALGQVTWKRANRPEEDYTYNNSPIAMSMLMSEKEPSAVVAVIKALEASGVHIKLKPGKRPEHHGSWSGYIYIPGDSSVFSGQIPGSNLVAVSEFYSQKEIEAEKHRLISLGYTEDDARAQLIISGYLVADPQQYEPLLNTDDFSSPVDKMATRLRSGQFSGVVDYSAVEDVRAIAKDAENWLNYMKGMFSLADICELIVGDILEGLKDLLRDPGAFFDGGAEGWWDDFVEKLKKQFKPPPFTMDFVDNLMTDNHMGNYEEELFKMLLGMVSLILAQIINLLIRHALEQCLEEDNDMGPAGRSTNSPESLPLPTIERVTLPDIENLEAPDIVAWMKDLIDTLSTAQLCALLRGDATTQTLQNCLAFTKDNWPLVYENGVDTIYEIRVAFEKLGKQLDLDICNIVQSSAPLTLFDNLCDAAFDRDARCEKLKLTGLTEEECQEQIDREIEDLKSKVSGLTNLSLFDINPLQNSFPPMCGEGGRFVVPPGVEDTMRRITDNMLQNVKGSLMIDMAGLKFFSTPPRSLLAMSDPEELANAHKMFTKAITNPYKKMCITRICCPHYLSYHYDRYDDTAGPTTNFKVYPMTYNKYLHYGNFSTWRGRLEEIQQTGISSEEYEQIKKDAQQLAYDSVWLPGGWYDIEVENREIGDVISAVKEKKALYEEELACVQGSYLYYKMDGVGEEGSIYEVRYGASAKNAGCHNTMGKNPPAWKDEKEKNYDLPYEEQLKEDDLYLVYKSKKISKLTSYITVADKVLKSLEEPGVLDLTGFFESFSDQSEINIFNEAYPDFFNEWQAAQDLAMANAEAEEDAQYINFLEEGVKSHFDEYGNPITDGLITTEKIQELFVLSDEEWRKDVHGTIVAGLGTSNNAATSLLEEASLSPITIEPLIVKTTGIPNTDSPQWSKPEYLEDFYTSLQFLNYFVLPERKEFVTNYVKAQLPNGYEGFGLTTGERKKLREEFTKQTQGVGIEDLTIHPDQLFKFRGTGGLIFAEGELTNSFYNFAGNIKSQNRSGYNFNWNNSKLRRSWNLNTKLKDIDSRWHMWLRMAQNYTGCPITFLRYTGGQSIAFPELFLQPTFVNAVDLESPDSLINTIAWFLRDEYNTKVKAGDVDEDLPIEDYVSLSLGSPHVSMFLNWLKISPGLRKLLAIASEMRLDGIDTTVDSPAISQSGGYVTKKNPGDLIKAFMELTLAEASGLEQERLLTMFPEMPNPVAGEVSVIFAQAELTPSQVLTFDMHAADHLTGLVAGEEFITAEKKDIVTAWDYFEASLGEDMTEAQEASHKTQISWHSEGYVPMFLVYERVFRDPDLPFNKPDDEVISYFSMNDDLVNKELYQFLNSFEHSLGGASHSAFEHAAIKKEIDIEKNDNFNPNVLRYDLPFEKITSIPQAGLDSESQTTEIMNVFASTSAAGDQLQEIASRLETINLSKSLVNQNICALIENNLNPQIEKLKNVSKFVKATISEPTSPAWDFGTKNILFDNSRIKKEIYNFDFDYNLDSDVQELISSLFIEDSSSPSISLLNTYDDKHEKNWHSQLGVPKVEALNFKAQVFGEFLTKKFMDKFDNYYNSENALDADYISQNKEEFKSNLKSLLSSYSYSSLQYAYSTQMFTKLKHSRIHKRGFMKKLWNKILKSPLTSNVDPRCQKLFDQLGVPSTNNLEETTTDFFKLEKVKPMIIEFYKKSLCRDVYEASSEEDNATRVSLLEGMIMLVAKVYSLEMCLAGIIAWDSFDLSSVFKDKSLVAIIVQNIAQDFDVDFISFFANDILRKEEQLTNRQLAVIKEEKSSLEYIIQREVENISGIVKSMFNNSFPLSTDLKIDLLKNSDPDFVDEYEKVFGSAVAEQARPQEYAQLHSLGNIEYVVDARIRNNVYTMNYGSPHQHSTYNKKPWNATITISDIFGHRSNRHDGNKNRLHSPPFNFYTAYKSQVDPKDLGFLGEDPMLVDFTKDEYFYLYYSGEGKAGPEELNNAQNLYKKWADRSNIAKRIDGFDLQHPLRVENDQKQKNLLQLEKSLLGLRGFGLRESFHEAVHGNAMNSKIGNITFQPYVRIVDYSADNLPDYNVYSYEGDDSKLYDACEPGTILKASLQDYAGVLDELLSAREGMGNIFNCHMFDYVPLAPWSYYYNNVFLKTINDYQDENGNYPLLLLFNKYGLKPFFKNIFFGMRMVYSTSHPFPSADFYNRETNTTLDFTKFKESAFFTADGVNSLKNAKCMFGHRGYLMSDEDHQTVLSELQIPIVEKEKELVFQEDTGLFKIDGRSEFFDIEDLGYYHGENTYNLYTELQAETLAVSGEIKHLTKNMQQFFYRKMANQFLSEIKKSSEFKLMFEYLLPMRRYMALSMTVATDGLSKFISDPTIVLEKTKNSLHTIITSLVNASDYNFTPSPVATMLADFAMRSEAGTTGKEMDLTKEILKILLRTPILILKGFVEATDPAIIIAKLIIDISNMIIFTTIAAIKQGVAIAKQVMDAGIAGAQSALVNLEVQLGITLGMINPIKAGFPAGLQEDIIIDTQKEDVNEWEVKINSPLSAEGAAIVNEMTPEAKESWEGFKTQLNETKTLVNEYQSIKSQLEALKQEKKELEEEFEKKLLETEEELKEVYKSPFLLPGLWAALIPSMMPYGGGIVPPPFPGGPPSTVPGMIYLALLLIDAIEEKMDEDMKNLGEDLNCEDQL